MPSDLLYSIGCCRTSSRARFITLQITTSIQLSEGLLSMPIQFRRTCAHQTLLLPVIKGRQQTEAPTIGRSVTILRTIIFLVTLPSRPRLSDWKAIPRWQLLPMGVPIRLSFQNVMVPVERVASRIRLRLMVTSGPILIASGDQYSVSINTASRRPLRDMSLV